MLTSLKSKEFNLRLQPRYILRYILTANDKKRDLMKDILKHIDFRETLPIEMSMDLSKLIVSSINNVREKDILTFSEETVVFGQP
jgi:hypothetical protein